MEDKRSAYLERLCGNLATYGGSGDLKKYTPVGEKVSDCLRWVSLLKLYPHYEHLPFIELDCENFDFDEPYHTCMCGKRNVINIHWIQRVGQENDPLLVVGSCCVNRFMEKQKGTSFRCATCHKFYKSGKFAECKECRMKRDGKVCTFCGETTDRKAKVCSDCHKLKDDYDRALRFYKRKLALKVLVLGKAPLLSLYLVLCVMTLCLCGKPE